MGDVADAVQRGLQVIANLPEEVHWLCDTIEEDSKGRIVVCNEDTETRQDSTLFAVMLLSFSDQDANQAWLKTHIARQLARCPNCVREFYLLKRKFYQKLLPEHGQENLDMFFEYLEDWDIERVQPELRILAADLERHPSADQWFEDLNSHKGRRDWYNPIYEVMCSPGMLRSAQLKSDFRKLCSTKKFLIQGPAEGLVTFLFMNGEEALKGMAEESWKKEGPAITPAIFETSLAKPLEDAVRNVESEMNPNKMGEFYQSLTTILKNVDKGIILRCISGAEKDPIKMAVLRIQPLLPYWPALLRLFQVLMSKLKRDVWEVISPLTPSGFGDVIFKDRHFGHLLRHTEQGAGGEAQLLDLTEWMSDYIASIDPLLRPTAAPSLLTQIFQSNLPALSKGMCLKEGMEILDLTLRAVEPEIREGNVLVRHAHDLFFTHIDLVSEVALSTTKFQDELMERNMVVAKQAAQDAIWSALLIGFRYVFADFERLSRKKAPVAPIYEMDVHPKVWDIVLRMFPTTEKDKATKLLEAFMPYLKMDKVYIASGEDPLRRVKESFNSRLLALNKQIAQALKGLSRCPSDFLEVLVSEQSVSEPILGLMMSRSQDVARAAEDVLLAAQRAEDVADALKLMLVKDISPPLLALTAINRQLGQVSLFSMMPRWVKTSTIILDVLCDRTEGLIRKPMLIGWAKTLLRVYWETQWRCLGTVFRRGRRWALGEDKSDMVEFFRDSMDYAETLFDNFWTFEQATRKDERDLEEREESWGDRLLVDASKVLNPFTTILSIQDDHLLQTCQKFMCKMLGLLGQNLKGEKLEQIKVDGFFENLKRVLYPESFPDHDPSKATPTNLTDVQKTELSVAASQIVADFAPPPKEKAVIELSDDDYGDIPDEDMLRAVEFGVKKPRSVQSKLEFPKGAPSAPKTSGPLRIGAAAINSAAMKKEQERQAFLAKRKADKMAKEKNLAAALARDKPTATKVVESSSSEDESSDEEGNNLFKLGNKVRSAASEAKAAVAPRRRKVPVVKKHVRDNRARIAPDLSPLYKQIFKWDFFHNDAFPPGLSATQYSAVQKSFKTFGGYKSTFEPLLLLEAWQSFLKCKDEATISSALEVKIATRMRADAFVELETTIDNMDDRNRWFESDIVLLSTNKNPLSSENAHHCLARVYNVTRKFKGPREVQLRCDPGPMMLQKMTHGGKLHGVKIMSLTPLEREYGSLVCLQYYDLRDEILEAKSRDLVEADPAEVKRMRDIYTVNDPQAKAIISATNGLGFTLIQGPPGTGKTKTVTGIVGAMLTPGFEPVRPLGWVPSEGSRKLLVCAPSNAAVDELVIRFMQGVKTMKGDTITPRIVRVGRSDAINQEVQDVTLEVLIDRRMGAQPNVPKGVGMAENEKLREAHTKLLEEKNQKQKQLDDARASKQDPGILLAEIDGMMDKLRAMRRELDDQRSQKKENDRNSEVIRRRAQQEIMNEAQIICATLSGSGHEMLRNVNVDFETVIIDEAAQSVELSALIPLKFGCAKCILVGDPQQLPPTVLSRAAAKFSYEKSLFVRMQENHPKNVHLLSIQYRMHPSISTFPSAEFYNSALQDGDAMAELRTVPWHSSTLFGPYRFFDIAGKETRGGTSLINRDEVQAALKLFERITADFEEINFDGRIGIVTPYRQQLNELRRQFEARFGQGIHNGVEFNTVDAFQGRERDIIIFSCVRAADEGGVGFLSDIRRMNVGLTRAKSSLFVLGNATFLKRNHMWGRLVEDAKARGLFTQGSYQSMFRNPTRTSSIPKALPPPPPKREVVVPVWDPMDICSDDNSTNIPKPQDDRPRAPQAPMIAKPKAPPQRDPLPPAPPPAPSYAQKQVYKQPPRNTGRPQDRAQDPHMNKQRPPQISNNLPQRPGPPMSAGRDNRDQNPNRQPSNRERQGGPGPSRANIMCLNCKQMGHMKSQCPQPPQRPDYIEDHDPRIPKLHDPSAAPPLAAPVKRPASPYGQPPPKRPHPNNTGSSGSSGNAGPPQQPRPSGMPNAPKPNIPRVIKRKNNANPLLSGRPNRPPPPRPPGPPPPRPA